jgi:uncharacterized protein (TIGR02996 family)
MHATSTLIIALHHQPNDSLCWLALADALEEEGRDDSAAMLRARLARLTDPNDVDAENRLLVAIRCGVQVPVPQLINSIGMEMALIPPGIFRWGRPQVNRTTFRRDPRHRVQIGGHFIWESILLRSSSSERS